MSLFQPFKKLGDEHFVPTVISDHTTPKIVDVPKQFAVPYCNQCDVELESKPTYFSGQLVYRYECPECHQDFYSNALYPKRLT